LFCKSCNQELDGELKYCPTCGEELISKEDNDTYTQSFDQEDVVQVELAPTEGNGKKGRKGIVPIVVALVAVLVITVVGVFGKDLFVKKDSADQLVDAYMNTFIDVRQAEYTSVIKINDIDFGNLTNSDPEVALVVKLLKDMEIKGKFKQDMQSNQNEMDFIFGFRGTDLVTLNIYQDLEGIAIKIPDFYSKQFYITWEDLTQFIREETGVQITVQEYIQLLTELQKDIKNLNAETYVNVFKEGISPNLTITKNQSIQINGNEVKGDLYAVELDINDLMVISMNLMQVILEDEDLFDMADQFVNKFVDTLEETGDAESMYLDSFTLQEIRDAIDFVRINKEYLLENISTEFESEMELNEEQINYTYNFYLNDNQVKALDARVSMSVVDPMTYENIYLSLAAQTVIESINNKISFTGMDKANGLNIVTLTEQDIENITAEITGNAMGLLFNPAISEILGEFMY
jgi:hypothetical protein